MLKFVEQKILFIIFFMFKFLLLCYEKLYSENVLFNLNSNASKGFYGCECVCVFLYEFFFIATYDSKSKNHCSVVWASDIKQTNKQKVKYTNLQFLMPVQKNKCNFLLSELSI